MVSNAAVSCLVLWDHFSAAYLGPIQKMATISQRWPWVMPIVGAVFFWGSALQTLVFAMFVLDFANENVVKHGDGVVVEKLGHIKDIEKENFMCS